MLRLCVFLGLIFLLRSNLGAQSTDSTILERDLLTPADLRERERGTRNEQIVTLDGEEREVASRPFETYVITQREIEENGYLTLTDALRTVPGIFVSPLGSAAEGELFMMQGIRGNRQAEILLNGMPIRPEGIAGMPLGAQIPLRQAERIEVIFGNGNHQPVMSATAGVINIVLKESNRPVFAQADLSIGDNRFNSLSVLFGGRLGRGKQQVRYTAYAGSTSFNNWNIGLTEGPISQRNPLFLPENYVVNDDLRYVSHPNFAGDAPNEVRFRNFPHQSRHVGLRVQFQLLEIMTDYRFRQEHAALGLNPIAISYDNPVNQTAESIARFLIRKRPGRRRFFYEMNAQGMLYVIDPFSNFEPIVPAVARTFEQSLLRGYLATDPDPVDPDEVATLVNSNISRNTAGERYRTAGLFDVFLHNGFGLRLGPHRLRFGLNSRLSVGFNEIEYLADPPTKELSIFNTSEEVLSTRYFRADEAFVPDVNNRLYVSGEWNGKRLRVQGGVAVQQSFNGRGEFATVGHGAASFQISDRLFLHGSLQNDFWTPNRHYQNRSFHFLDNDRVDPADGLRLRPVQSLRTDFGFFWRPDEKRTLRLTAFLVRSTNTLQYDEFEYDLPGLGTILTTGYFTFPQSNRRLAGMQGQFVAQDVLGWRGMETKLSVVLSNGRQTLGRQMRRFDRVDDFPPLLIYWRLGYRRLRYWYFAVENIFQTSARSAAHPEAETPTTMTTDATIRYALSRHLTAYVRATNLFNVSYAGIGAVESPDALLWNAQPLFRFRLGLNYNLDAVNY